MKFNSTNINDQQNTRFPHHDGSFSHVLNLNFLGKKKQIFSFLYFSGLSIAGAATLVAGHFLDHLHAHLSSIGHCDKDPSGGGHAGGKGLLVEGWISKEPQLGSFCWICFFSRTSGIEALTSKSCTMYGFLMIYFGLPSLFQQCPGAPVDNIS